MARDEGVLVSISSNAHSVLELNNMKYGIGQARPGWLRTERSGDGSCA
jgi:DNA polymerase (family 10)